MFDVRIDLDVVGNIAQGVAGGKLADSVDLHITPIHHVLGRRQTPETIRLNEEPGELVDETVRRRRCVGIGNLHCDLAARCRP